MASRSYLYSTIVTNEYLGLSKEVKGDTEYEVRMKAEELRRRWDEREKRERERKHVMDLKEQAERDTKEAQELIEQYRNILHTTLTVDDRIKWKLLYDRKPFRSFRFQETEPTYDSIVKELNVPASTKLEIILPGRKAKRRALEEQAKQVFEQRRQEYEERKRAAMEAYEKEKAEYERKQKEYNDGIDAFKGAFESGDPSAIEKYIRLVLEYSKYPEGIEKEFEVQFNPQNNTVIIDYKLPNPESIPRVVE
ncbi:MAG TPA: cell envelope integrity protein TolA, partial [Clostridia bacterium]|nr:cell envelope integrity protein TolA [Clostridia bacterium]